MRVLGVIPARLNSERLPRKVLRPIAGRPMVWHTWDRVRRSPLLDELIVATDSEEVGKFCWSEGISWAMTSPNHPSGTDRCLEVATDRRADFVVNIQADEPLVTPGHVEALLRPFLRPDSPSVVTLARPLPSPESLGDPNVVKVVRRLGYAEGFVRKVRQPIGGHDYLIHIGMYAYTRLALRFFAAWGPSESERWARLEQLRFLCHDVPIAVADAPADTIGVNTEDDLRRVEAILTRDEQ